MSWSTMQEWATRRKLDSMTSIHRVSFIISIRSALNNHWNNKTLGQLLPDPLSLRLTVKALCRPRGQGGSRRSRRFGDSRGGGGELEVCDWQNPHGVSGSVKPASRRRHRETDRKSCDRRRSITGVWAENVKHSSMTEIVLWKQWSKSPLLW